MPPAVGMVILRATEQELRARMLLDNDKPAHRQLAADAQAGLLSGISFGDWQLLSRDVQANGAGLRNVFYVVELGEVSVIRRPGLPTCFSSVSVSSC
ncbi:MAG: hypothetical protein ACYC6N_18810 [Pirellulaceae bacterium]